MCALKEGLRCDSPNSILPAFANWEDFGVPHAGGDPPDFFFQSVGVSVLWFRVQGLGIEWLRLCGFVFVSVSGCRAVLCGSAKKGLGTRLQCPPSNVSVNGLVKSLLEWYYRY